MGNTVSAEDRLHQLISQGNVQLVAQQLEIIPVNALNLEGESALRIAYFKGQLDCIILLEERGGQIIPPLSNKETTLHLSVRLEYYEVAQHILTHNQNDRKFINAKDKFGLTALHMAVAKKDIRMVKILLKFKASIRIKNNQGDDVRSMADQLKSQPGLEIKKIINTYYFERIAVKEKRQSRMRRQTAPQNVPQINVMQAEQRAPLLKINDLKNTKSDECLRTNLFKANNQKNTSFEQQLHQLWTQQSNSNISLSPKSALLDTRLRLGSNESTSSNEDKGIESILQNFNFIDQSQIQLDNMISRGSTCTVFKAKWRNSTVAVKEFYSEFSQKTTRIQQFLTELKILMQNRHCSIITFMGVSLNNDKLQIITEYFENKSLFEMIQKNTIKLSIQNKLEIAIDIASALVFLHSNDPPIIHRDIKLENIFITNKLQAKLGDFGLSRFQQNIQKNTEMLRSGTPRFMAPEQFQQNIDRLITPATDIWSFGCFLIEIFSEQRAWTSSVIGKHADFIDLMRRKVPIPIPSRIPKYVQNLIKNCCNYTPSHRIDSVTLQTQLEYLKNKL